MMAALPLIERIKARGFGVLVTSGTVTSAGLARQRLPHGAIHQFIAARYAGFCRPASSIIGGRLSRCSSNPTCGRI